MSGAYYQLLDATIGHLQSLKQRGVRHVDASPERLMALAQPPERIVSSPVGQALGQAPAPVEMQPSRGDAPAIHDLPKLSANEKAAAMARLTEEALACTKCEALVASRTQVVVGVGTVEAGTASCKHFALYSRGKLADRRPLTPRGMSGRGQMAFFRNSTNFPTREKCPSSLLLSLISNQLNHLDHAGENNE